MKKKRTMIQLTPNQLEFLDRESKRLQISRSEFIRRIMDTFMLNKAVLIPPFSTPESGLIPARPLTTTISPRTT